MAFREADKSTPKPFNDKKPDNFIQQKPFHDSDLENQVWDDISKLGGKQIAREEIDLIYRAFAEKIASISSEIEELKSKTKSDSKESIDNIDKLVKKSDDLTENEKEESEKIDSSISSLVNLKDITKVDENLDKKSTDLDEKLLSKIYEKIVKSISSPSILVPFITKISEKIYDSITQASSKTFNELNKEFKEQLKVDVLGDIKDIAKSDKIKTIKGSKEDEEAIRRLAAEEAKKKAKEKKDKSKSDETSIDAIKKNSQKSTINQQEIEDTTIKKSFNSVREALIASSESLNDSNQRIRKIWDESLKTNDLEEYSTVSAELSNESDGKKKVEDEQKSQSKNGGNFNIGRFALIGALAACYFLFKYNASQEHIQKYIESHHSADSIQKEIENTVENGINDVENGIQKEIGKDFDPSKLDSGGNEKETKQSYNDLEESNLDREIEKYVFDSSKESQERLDAFLQEYNLKNSSLDRVIRERQEAAKKAGENLQIEIEKIQTKSKKAEREVHGFVNDREKENKYDKKITDSASGLIMTEMDVIIRQDNEIKRRIKIEEEMVENEKKNNEWTLKKMTESFDDFQDDIEEELRNNPDVQEKLAKARKRSIREIEKSGIEVTDLIDKEFSRLTKDVLKYNDLIENSNDVIEAATDDSKYVIIEMKSYLQLLQSIFKIGDKSLEFDHEVISKLGFTPMR